MLLLMIKELWSIQTWYEKKSKGVSVEFGFNSSYEKKLKLGHEVRVSSWSGCLSSCLGIAKKNREKEGVRWVQSETEKWESLLNREETPMVIWIREEQVAAAMVQLALMVEIWCNSVQWRLRNSCSSIWRDGEI